MSKAVVEAGNLLKDVLERAELKHMGWLSEKVCVLGLQCEVMRLIFIVCFVLLLECN